MDIRPEDWHIWEWSSFSAISTPSQERELGLRRLRHRHHPYSDDSLRLRGRGNNPRNFGSRGNRKEENYSSVVPVFKKGFPRFEQNKLPTCLPGSLFRRQQGIPGSSQFNHILEHEMMRQLIASRASLDTEIAPMNVETDVIPVKKSTQGINKDKDNTGMKWTRITDDDSGMEIERRLKSLFPNNVTVIKGGGVNAFLLPSPPMQSPSPNSIITDEDKMTLKWCDQEISFINMYNPKLTEDCKILKLSNTLLVLEAEKLVAYDFNSGKRLDELVLSFPKGPDRYDYIFVDSEYDGRIYVSAYNSAVQINNPEMWFELLILSYPPLKVLSRLLVPKCGDFGGSVGIENGLLFSTQLTGVEVFSLEKVMEVNLQDEQIAVSLDGLRSHSIVFLKHKPIALAKLKAHEGIMFFIKDASPPHICCKTENTFQIRGLDNLPEVNKQSKLIWEILNKTSAEDVSIHKYDKYKPRIAVEGLMHGFDILELDAVSGSMNLMYSTKNDDKAAQSPGRRDENTSQESSRDCADLDLSRIFGYGYDEDLELLAVCMVEDGVLFTRILNNKDFKLFKKLTPVKLSLPTGTVELGCSLVDVAFNGWFIRVEVTLFDAKSNEDTSFQEIYIGNLLREAVPEDENLGMASITST